MTDEDAAGKTIRWRRARLFRLLLVPGSHVGWVGLRTLISREAGAVVVGESLTPETAVQLAQELQPDAVLMDAEPHGFPGPVLARRFRTKCPECKLLVFATRRSAHVARAMVDLDASCFITWDNIEPHDFHYILETALAGSLFVCGREVAQALISPGGAKVEARKQLMSLSGREYEVLDRLTQGMSERSISAQTGIPLRSVERIVSRLEAMLHVSSLNELRMRAHDLGFGS